MSLPRPHIINNYNQKNVVVKPVSLPYEEISARLKFENSTLSDFNDAGLPAPETMTAGYGLPPSRIPGSEAQLLAYTHTHTHTKKQRAHGDTQNSFNALRKH